jgi:hypothetical protein
MHRANTYLRLWVLNFRTVRRGKMGAYMGVEGRRGDVFWF